MTRRTLAALHIGNFKAFADTQRIPLKPITLIFGPNSAGKSSFIQSLAFAHEAEFGRDQSGVARLDVHRTGIGGDSIDLGGFRQFVHKGQASRRMEWGAELDVTTLDARSQGLLEGVGKISVVLGIGIQLDDQERARRDAAPRIDSVTIAADGTELLHLSPRHVDSDGSIFRLDRLASGHAIFRRMARAVIETFTTTESLRDDDMPHVDDAIAALLPDLEAQGGRLFPDAIRLRGSEEAAMSTAPLLTPINRGDRGAGIAQALRQYLPGMLDDLLGGVSRAIATRLKCLRYLGPVRERPTRHLAYPDQRDINWEAGGAFAWDVLVRDQAVRDRVNEWLGGHPGLSIAEAALKAVQASSTKTASWMKTPYWLFVDRYTANTELRDALVQAFYERPLTLLQRRELLTKSLAQVYATLQEQYETDQARAEQYAKEMQPWIERIQAAKSPAEGDRLLAEAMEHFQSELDRQFDSPEAQRGMFEEQLAEDAPHEEAIARSMEFMTALAKSGAATIAELRLWDVRKRTAVSLCDVGFGISQVLPVLTLAYGSENRLIAIEQPEIHLHPALQAELADVFIESALGERQNTFILETHSEHLILRLLRRIRETTNGELPEGIQALHPGDVQIIYVQPDASGSRFIELSIDSDGEFVDRWPGDGFFPERAKELF